MSNSPEGADNYGVPLYYPHIHVRDIDWLKCTLLYWDRVRRIVPDDFPPDDKDEKRSDVLRAIKAGVLVRTNTSPYVDKASELFINCALDLRGRRGAGSWANGFDFLGALASRTKPAAKQDKRGARASRDHERLKGLLGRLRVDEDPAEVDIWNSKMHDELARLFQEAGLARKVEGGDYMMVQKAAADLYMACLATAMKQAIGSPLVTDSDACNEIGKFLDYGRMGPDPDRGSVLLELGIPYPTPASVRDVSMAKILKFHEKSGPERRRFRKAVEAIVAKAAVAREIDEYRGADLLKDESQALKDAIESHRDKMQLVGIKGFSSLLKVGAPAGIASLAAAGGALSPGLAVNPISGGILVGTGVVMSLIAWWAEVRGERRKEVEGNPWHYLLSLKRRFPSRATNQGKR
jgi:hypothetical protein